MNIVYVDDDEEDRSFFVEALAEINDQVQLTVFENGYQLIDFLRTINSHHQLPCSIICDMHMPVLNGADLVRLLKEEPRWAGIPTIIFSTSSGLPDPAKAIDPKLISFLSKPSTFEELKAAVLQILDLCHERLAIRTQNEPSK